jgi:hypothetical protein
MKFFKLIIIFVLFIYSGTTLGQYAFQDFVGEWNGYISSTSFGGYNDQIKMVIESDGYYTESTGRLMPTIYPNTQKCEYEASTNRFHWWYLQSVYAGRNSYTNHYYDVVYFKNDTLIMHYNYWDDPEPYPNVGTIFLVKENVLPSPKGLAADLTENDVTLEWNTPSNGGGNEDSVIGYNIYHKPIIGSFRLLSTVQNTSYTHENVTNGMHSYYVTTVFESGESGPSNEVVVDVRLSSVGNLSSTGIRIFPNPATQFIHINAEANLEIIKIYNNTGQLQKVFNLCEGTQTILNIEDLKAGIYLVLIESSRGITSLSLLKR